MNQNNEKLTRGQMYLRVISFVKPFKWMMVYSVILTLCFSFFNALSVSLIKPVFQIIFKTDAVANQIPSNPKAQSGFFGLLQNAKDWFFDNIMAFIHTDNVYNSLIRFGIIIVIVFALKNAFKYWGAVISAKFEEGVIKSIRDTVFEKLTSLSIDFFNRNKQGTLISLIANDVAAVNQTMINSFTAIMREASQVIAFLFLLLSVSAELTLLAFSSSIISLLIVRSASKFLRRYATRMQKALADYTGTLTEIISGIRAVKSYNAEEHANNRFKKDSRTYVRSAVKHKMIITLIPSINEVFAIAAMTIVLLVGAMKISSGELKADELMLFLFSLFSIMSPITSVINQFVQFPRGFVSAERLMEVLNAEPSVDDGRIESIEFNKEIEIRDLSFAYNEVEVLKNVNFKISKGKKVAFVGASGSGKSTMLDLLIRFYDPTKGEILVDGINIKDVKIKSYRELFGIVSQETILFNDTVANNISFGDTRRDRSQIETAAKLSNSYNFIQKMDNGFDSMLGDRGVNLSGGERQRVAIARALLRDPEVLVFDEATSALDAESEKIVQGAINESLENKTAIIVAHRLSTIMHCDEILVFERGEVVERGTHSELYEMNGVYRNLCDIQFKRGE